MNKEKFVKELEERLEENRRILDKSVLPDWLKPAASYLGLHTVRMLLIVSLVINGWWFLNHYELMIVISKKIFGYG